MTIPKPPIVQYVKSQAQKERETRQEIARIKKEERTSRLAAWKDLMKLEKSKPCMDCNGAFPPYVLEFDHRVPTDKSFSIGKSKDKTPAEILEEIAKCDLVCSNCHRIRTYTRRQ